VQARLLLRRASLVIAGVAMLCLASPVASSASPQPRRLVLQLSDLATGFGIDKSGVRTNKQVAKDDASTPVGQLVRWGRIGGWETDFSKDTSVAGLLSGAIGGESLASVYKTEKGARASFVVAASRCARKPFKEISAGVRFGDETHLCSLVRKSNGQTIRVFTLIWRRGTVTAALVLAGVEGRIRPEEAVALGRRQDARIKAEVRG
jgi:hypothetical protein